MRSAKNFELSFEKLSIDKQTKLGDGAIGVVYLAQYNNAQVAVKMALESSSENKLLLEHEILSKINKIWTASNSVTGLMKYYGYSKDENNSMLLVMEYSDAGTLSNWVFGENQIKNLPAYNWELAYPVVKDIAMGLYWLHANGFIHCDLRGENVFLHNEGEK